MATPLLFDLSEIDLDAVALDAEAVGQINPQTGDMRQLDYLVWRNDDCTEGIGVKHVQHDEFWVPHHIPGRPLMPGVLIIEAAAQVSALIHTLGNERNRGKFLGFARCDKVAFRGQVQPGDTLYLLSRELENRQRRFITETQGVVDGKLVFEGIITGMIL